MKKSSIIAISLMFVLSLFVFLSVNKENDNSMRLFMTDVNALSYSNELPGAQGSRHSQAVWCGGGGWVVKAGCCYGYESCYIMDPCRGRSFSCDGNTWM